MEPLSIILFITLFFLSAVFSGSEIALMSLPMHKISMMIRQRKANAKILHYIKSHNDRLLITILIGNNLVNVYTAALATTISIDLANSSGLEQSIAIGLATGIVTLLLLLFGEIAPKTIATRHTESISLFVARFYYVLMFILYPVIIAIEWLMKLLNKSTTRKTITDDEIEAIIDIAKKEGIFDIDEYNKLKRIMRFSDTTVEEIMTPRVKVNALSSNLTIKQAIQKAMDYTHTRLPIYEKTMDMIESFITLKDLLTYERSGKGSEKLKHCKLIPVLKVPLNQPINKLLETFRKTRKHLAIVIDEYGGVAGLVTLEDVVEEVFGDIKDETDQESDDYTKISMTQREVHGHVMFDDALEKIGLTIHDLKLNENAHHDETLSYFITHHLGRFPKNDEIIKLELHEDNQHREVLLQVLDITDQSINNVSITLA